MSRQSDRREAARAARARLVNQQRKKRMMWTSVTAVVVLLLAGLIGWGVYAAQQPDEGFAVPAGAMDDGGGLRIGSGPVTVEVYLDYLCPGCAQFERTAEPMLRRYLDDKRITLVLHPVAILDRESTNRYSSRAAAGAGCAADGDKLFDYTKALYDNQPTEGGAGHTDAKLADLAAGTGLDRDRFASCLRDGRYAEWVEHLTTAMDQRQVTSTPTVFVNRKQLARPTVDALVSAVDAA